MVSGTSVLLSFTIYYIIKERTFKDQALSMIKGKAHGPGFTKNAFRFNFHPLAGVHYAMNLLPH